MTDNTDSSDTAQSYQLNRRNLLRAGGATAGVAAAGGIPSLSDEIDQPVGSADAVDPGQYIIASSAGIVGLAALGVSSYLTDDGDLDAEDVEDTASRQSVYNAAESAILAQRSAVKTVVNDLGVGVNGSGDVGWINQQSNAHRQQLIEHSTAETALAWDEGKSLSEAQLRGKNAARAVSVTAEISLVNLWNDFAAAVSKSIKRDITTESSTRYRMMEFEYETTPSPTSTNYTDETGVESIVDVEVGSGWSYGTPTALLSIDYESSLPTPSEYLPPEDQPESYTIFAIPILEYGGSERLVCPRTTLDPDPDTVGTWQWAEDYSSDTPQTGSPGLIGSHYQLTVSYDSSSVNFDLNWFQAGLDAIQSMRSNIIGSTLDSYTETVYNALESGDISVQDVVSGRQLYKDLQPGEDVSLQSVTLASAGATGAIDQSITVSTGQRTVSGIPFVEAASQIDLSAGTTLAAGDYDRLHLIQDDGSRETISDTQITIDSVNGDESGDQTISFDPPADIGDPTGITEEEVRQIVKEDQQRYDKLKNQIEELESDGGGGDSPLGIGGLGSGDNGILIAGGALVAAYLLGR